MDIDLDNAEDIETFLLDALDKLCQENTSEVTKLQILSNLQERVQWASLNVTSAEHVTGSLKNMFIYPGINDGQFFKSQLLVTLTVVLILSSSKLKNLQENCETLHSSIQFLTDIISKVNEPSSVLTRKTACECLWEIEISYPGLMQDRLGCFFKYCEQECSVIFQSYMTNFDIYLHISYGSCTSLNSQQKIRNSQSTILFVTTLKNAILHISTFQKDIPENQTYLNELLSSEADLSMKMNCLSELVVIEEQFPVIMNFVAGHHYDVRLPTKFQNKEIKRAVSFIAENYNLLTSIPLFHVLLQLMHCIKLASLSPSVFKSQFVKSLFNTMDLPLFQLVLLLKFTFRNQLFEETDSIILLQRLCHLSTQRFLGISQRLLCFHWLINFPQDVKAEEERKSDFLAECLDFTERAKFHPTVFDPLEIIPGKLDVLSCCYTPGDGPDIASATLMNCLVCLRKPVKHGLKRPYAALLFQVLFSYYSRHHDSVALVQEIYRFLLSIATDHPDLVPYILDFTISVSVLTPESYLPCEILRNFTDYIVALPLKKQIKNIRNFLKAFEYAMKLKDIPPKGTIGYLQQLAMCDEIRSSSANWSIGNAILHVCRNILQYHDTSKIIAEFGECLLTINKTNQDIDICDRAMFYYTLLTTISTEKCARLLTGTITNLGKIKTAHLSERPGLATSSFPLAMPIKTINEPFLTLTSGAGPTRWSNGCGEIIGSSDDYNIQEYFSSYLKQVENRADHMSITIPFYLHYVVEPNEEIPDMIFAVVIQMRTSSKYKIIPDIHVPYLSYKKSCEPADGCQIVEVKFSPVEPVPATFDIRIIYSSTASSSYIMALKPIVIEFHDIFIPLKHSIQVHIVYNMPCFFLQFCLKITSQCLSKPDLGVAFSPEQMFDVLWQYIEEHQYSRKNQSFSGAKSIVYLNFEKEKVEVILQKFDNIIIKRDDTEAYVGVFLPPKHHFLLRFVLHSTHSVVHVATDRWQVLASLVEFLKCGRTINVENSSSMMV